MTAEIYNDAGEWYNGAGVEPYAAGNYASYLIEVPELAGDHGTYLVIAPPLPQDTYTVVFRASGIVRGVGKLVV